MKRMLMTFALLGALLTGHEAYAEDGSSCLGFILPEGDYARFCYPLTVSGGWELFQADAVESGFAVSAFVLRRETCRRRKKGGECVSFREEEVRVTIYRSAGMSLNEAGRIIGMLEGAKRVRKRGQIRRLERPSGRRGNVIDLFVLEGHPRFLVGVLTPKGGAAHGTAATRFVSGLQIDISTPR